MGKHVITTQVEKELKDIAKSLPVDLYGIESFKKIPEEDLELSGLVIGKNCKFYEEKDGVKYYVFFDPQYFEVNHNRRLRKAYKSGGVKEVWNYVKKYNDRAAKK